MNKLNFSENLTNYPLTIEGLDLLQNAITLAASGALTGASGSGCYILSGCTEASGMVQPGILLINGELFSIAKALAKDTYVHVVSTTEDVTVSVDSYEKARTLKTITFEKVDTNDGNFFAWDGFVRIKTNIDLYKLITTNVDANPVSSTNYLVPKGGIIMWSGAINDIPAGWALCNGDNGTPDLRGRFVVGYSNINNNSANSNSTNYWEVNYGTPRNTGGEQSHKLQSCEVPKHTHSIKTGGDDCADNNTNDNLHGQNDDEGWGNWYTTTPAGGNSSGGTDPHENRPPYLVLAYIMKL